MSLISEKLRSRIEATGTSPSVPVLLTTIAVVIAVTSSLLIYPEVAGSLNNRITTDRYDELGLGVYHTGTLSFYPDLEPTVLRAPLYPYLLAALFAIGQHLMPYSIQLSQALLHGLTCLLAYHITKQLARPGRALLAALLCVIHPYLLWYTGRVVIETVSIFLFTLIIFCVLRLTCRPTLLNALWAGLAIGAGVLCKSTYIPFIFAVPLLLSFSRPRRTPISRILIVFALSLLTITPWIIRNHNVSGQWGVVQALTGYNFYVGDRFVERYPESPLSYATIIARTDFSKMDEGLPEDIQRATGARREVLQDEWLLARSIDRYWREPGFLVEKVATNIVMFWTLGSTPAVSILTMVLQLPLLFFFIRSGIRRMRVKGVLCAECLPFWLVALYFGIHLPVYALARFSVVFIPTMIAFALLPSAPRSPGR
jgi:4-amino-4-deoxy-L-arabinose transferase-like glycosyltransferase